MKTAKITPAQALAIANYIAKNQSDSIRASNNKRSVTSTRITFSYNNGVAEIYSAYTNDNVVNELPAKYRAMFN